MVSSPNGDHTMRGRRGLGTRSADAYLCCLLYSVSLFLLGVCPHIDLYGFNRAESSDSVDESSVQNMLVLLKAFLPHVVTWGCWALVEQIFGFLWIPGPNINKKIMYFNKNPGCAFGAWIQ